MSKTCSLKCKSSVFRRRKNLGRTPPHYKMQNEGNNGEHQKQVDQPSGDVENRESPNPRYQQYNEQNCPNAHLCLTFAAPHAERQGKP